jgi:2-dehydro-3-deoxygluconokinase
MTMTLCVGEALISLTPAAGTPLEDAEQLHMSEAGAELNVAIHLARLGIPTRFAGKVGADPLGSRLRRTLERSGVDVQYLEQDPTRNTGVYLKNATGSTSTVHYYRAGSAATTYREVPQPATIGVDHVHLSGITPALSEDCRHLVRSLLDSSQFRTSFDVNYRSALWSPADAGLVLLDLARRADIVFVGLDEATTVWGPTAHADVRDLLPDCAELVIKDGPRAAFAYVGAQVYRAPAPQVDVVEPVGAGDAFAAGYLAARQSGRNPRMAMRWGHQLASQVLQVLGDHQTDIDRATLNRLDDLEDRDDQGDLHDVAL